MRSNPTLCEDGGIGISGYAVLAIFWIGFCKENLWLEFAAFSFLMHLYFASKQKMQAVFWIGVQFLLKFWNKPETFLHRGLLVLDKAKDFVLPLRCTMIRLQNVSQHAPTKEEGLQEIVDRNFFDEEA